MKKMIIFGAGLLLAAGVVLFAVNNKPMAEEEALLLANVEAIAQNEGIPSISLDDQVNNARTCTTTKEFRVDIGGGNYKLEYKEVRGLENPCRNAPGICEAFACYAN